MQEDGGEAIRGRDVIRRSIAAVPRGAYCRAVSAHPIPEEHSFANEIVRRAEAVASRFLGLEPRDITPCDADPGAKRAPTD